MSDGLIELAFDGARRRLQGEVRNLGGEVTSVLRDAAAPARRTELSGGASRPAADIENPRNLDAFAIEEKCKRAWASDPDLRAEFRGHYEAYLAYSRAEAKGLVRIFGGRRREA